LTGHSGVGPRLSTRAVEQQDQPSNGPDPSKAMQEASPPASVRHWKALAVLVTLACAAPLLALWRYHGWYLEQLALIGDASAPIVGILSLAAIVAALASVHLQRQALAVQNDAVRFQVQEGKEQQAVVAEQLAGQRRALDLQADALKLQGEDLKKQQEALEIELKYRRHVALREAYAPLLAAQDAYLDAVDEYWKRLTVYFTADRATRDKWKIPVDAAYADLQRALWPTQLVDTDKERGHRRWYMMRKIRLEPLVDTTANQTAYRAVIQYKLLRTRDDFGKLLRSLRHELGAPERDEKPESEAQMEKWIAEAKAKADAVEATIKTQWTEYMMAHQVVADADPDDDDE
jgi:hypothetical protein